jgi:hypothetical protein
MYEATKSMVYIATAILWVLSSMYCNIIPLFDLSFWNSFSYRFSSQFQYFWKPSTSGLEFIIAALKNDRISHSPVATLRGTKERWKFLFFRVSTLVAHGKQMLCLWGLLYSFHFYISLLPFCYFVTVVVRGMWLSACIVWYKNCVLIRVSTCKWSWHIRTNTPVRSEFCFKKMGSKTLSDTSLPNI